MIVFLLDSLSLEIYSETFSEYLPSLFLHIITSLTEHCDAINSYQMNAALKLCLKILSKIRSPLPTSQNDENANTFGVFQNHQDQRMIMSEPGKIVQLTKVNISSSLSNEEAAQEDDSGTELVVSSNDGEDDPLFVLEDSEEADNTEKDASILDELPEKEPSTMEKCLRDYKKFYVTFVYILRLKLGDTKNITNLFELLVIKSSETAAEDRIRILEALLRRILRNYKVLPSSQSEVSLCDCEDDEPDRNDCLFASFHAKDKIGDEWKDAVHHASKLLIELSTFETSVPSSVTFNGVYCVLKFYD